LYERDIKMKRSSAERVGAVVVAAGSSRRMEGVDKVFTPLAGEPLLVHVLRVFEECHLVDEVVVVLSAAGLERGRELVAMHGLSKVTALCLGGERRQDSVAQGLSKLEDCCWVVIHDGARPCVTADLIERGLDEARETGAAIAAVPVKETLKVVDAERLIRDTPKRENLWLAQTPQVFRFDIMIQAHQQVKDEVTDDAAMAEALGHKVRVYMGSYGNVKVTTPEDLALAEIILRERRESRYRL
jgi:2-C-methyl-D-erythritol 4-phosphate cytidylyltransferase